jgi:hypothetical protein
LYSNSRNIAVVMPAFTFKFDLEDDLDAISPHELAAVPSIDKALVSQGAPATKAGLWSDT